MDNSQRANGAGTSSCYAAAVRDNSNLVPAVTRAIVCIVHISEKLAVTNDLAICMMLIPPSSLDDRESVQKTAQTLSAVPIWKPLHTTGAEYSLAGRTPYGFAGPCLISPGQSTWDWKRIESNAHSQ